MGLLIVLKAPATAAPINIINPSFEDPSVPHTTWIYDISGWTQSSGTTQGTWNPDTWFHVPDGQQIAFLQQGSYIYQTLTATIEANTLYDLQAYFAKTADWEDVHYTLQLIAAEDNYVLDQITGQPAYISFQQVGFTYWSTNQYIGDHLQIKILSDAMELDVDNVTLDKYIDPPVPIPSTLILLGTGIASMALRWRRRS
jgi:hypothetical protein